MSEDEKKNKSSNRIDDKQRFNYIGFEVFPGTPKDLFTSEAEKAKYVDSLVARRNKGELIREDCTLMEERVSTLDRAILSIACVVILISLFFPWYSVYNAVEEVYEAPAEAVADSLGLASTDSLSMAVSADMQNDSATTLATTENASEGNTDNNQTSSASSGSSTEEVLHGYVAKKKINNVYEHVAGIGGLLAIGSVGSYLFSSGFILILTGVIVILLTLLSIGLPIYTLYGIWGVKGTADQRALTLKKILKLSWAPLALFVFAMFLSLFGAEYSFDAESMYTSLGESYSIGVFLDSLSWGILVMLGASILVAAKGSEI